MRLAIRAKDLGRLNEEIVVVATDTTDNDYKHKTGVKYKTYLDWKKLPLAEDISQLVLCGI